MDYLTPYNKALPSAVIAALAVAILSVTLILPSLAQAQNNGENSERRSEALQIAESFLESRGSSSASSSVFDWLPEDFLERFFERFFDDDDDKPGVGNDTTDPEISDIDADADEDTATIAWETDEKTRGTVFVSTETPVDQDDEDTIEVKTPRRWNTEHSVEVSGLDPDTTYYALIEAKDKARNTALSDEFDFTTGDDDDDDSDTLTITNQAATATDTTIEVSWDTDEEADSELFLSTVDPVDEDATTTIEVSDDDLTEDHMLTATGLDPDTTYYGIVRSTDEDGNTATSSQFEISTLEDDDDDTTAPIISALDADSGTTSISVTWTTDEPATSALYAATSTGFDIEDDGVEEVTDGTLSLTHDLTLSGLSTSTAYYYRVVSEDEDGNQATSSEYTISTD